MKPFPIKNRTLALIAVIVPLLALFIYVGLRSGPLAPIPVTMITVKSKSISPSLFGIGNVEARYTYKIGPTFTGRVSKLEVNVGDHVKVGQVLGEMDSVDLDDRLHSQNAIIKRTQAALRESTARLALAQSQSRRYEQLFTSRSISEEYITTKRQELQIAEAVHEAVKEDINRAKADSEVLNSQRRNLRLIAPIEGIVVLRNIDPGTTVVAGQSIIEIIDPKSLWINVRIDQVSAFGLSAGRPASIQLRSRGDQLLSGHVLRVEPKADAITEETLTKVVFDEQPALIPSIGELAEVTIQLASQATAPTIPNAAIVRNEGKIGVWKILNGKLQFTPIRIGVSDLDGNVQILDGLQLGDKIVLYSSKILTPNSRIEIVQQIAGVTK